jgi:hypothetical protein
LLPLDLVPALAAPFSRWKWVGFKEAGLETRATTAAQQRTPKPFAYLRPRPPSTPLLLPLDLIPVLASPFSRWGWAGFKEQVWKPALRRRRHDALWALRARATVWPPRTPAWPRCLAALAALSAVVAQASVRLRFASCHAFVASMICVKVVKILRLCHF